MYVPLVRLPAQHAKTHRKLASHVQMDIFSTRSIQLVFEAAQPLISTQANKTSVSFATPLALIAVILPSVVVSVAAIQPSIYRLEHVLMNARFYPQIMI